MQSQSLYEQQCGHLDFRKQIDETFRRVPSSADRPSGLFEDAAVLHAARLCLERNRWAMAAAGLQYVAYRYCPRRLLQEKLPLIRTLRIKIEFDHVG